MRTVTVDGLEVKISLRKTLAYIIDPSNGKTLGVYRRTPDGELRFLPSPFLSKLVFGSDGPPQTVREYVDTYL